MTKKFDMVIYHGNCADGFTAAWVAHQVLGDEGVEYVPGFYGKEPPDVTGKHVLMVDFSYKRDVLLDMAHIVRSITILDHHKSAKEDLVDFIWDDGDTLLTPNDLEVYHSGTGTAIQAQFDMERSGAMMTWDYFHLGEHAPALVDYVQDRDLWLFKLHGSRELATWLFSFEYTWENWDNAAVVMMDSRFRRDAVLEGKALERKHDKDIRELLAVNTFEVVIGGHVVKVANMPYTMAADAAHILAEGRPLGATFFINAAGKYSWSFRSTAEGVDVSEIASTLGGGGHARAAGCLTSMMFPRYHSAETDSTNTLP